MPEDRQGTIVDLIGKRGTADDLAFIYRAGDSPRDGVSAAVRVKALEALAGAAANRNLKPPRDLEKLVPLVQDRRHRSPDARSEGPRSVWPVSGSSSRRRGALADLARSEAADEALRAEAFDALATIGGKAGSAPIEALAGRQRAGSARGCWRSPRWPGWISRGPRLARPRSWQSRRSRAAISCRSWAPFSTGRGARRCWRRHSKAARSRLIRPNLGCGPFMPWAGPTRRLVAVLSRAAGITELSKPLSPSELSTLVAEVAAKGDPARGERDLPPERLELHELSLGFQGRRRRRARLERRRSDLTAGLHHQLDSQPRPGDQGAVHTLVVMTVEGQVFQGIVTDKDEQRVVLKDATGATRVVPAASIEDQKPGGSLMPKGLANLMTRAEFLDLVRFLSELGKPGPYAIRAGAGNPALEGLKAVARGSGEIGS